MRKLLLTLALGLVSLAAMAQYAPPVNPVGGSTVAFWAAGPTSQLAASGTSARVALAGVVPTAGQIQVFNNTTAVAFVACGDVTIVATVGSAGTATSSYPVAPGSVVVISRPQNAGYCAAILSTSTGAVYFSPGGGL